jgi:glycosyltransferase involved in cell wall biosynthesis
VTAVLMTADAVGGVWRYAIDLAAELAGRGATLTLAVMGPPPDDAQRDEAAAAGVGVVDRPYRLEWMPDPWEDVARAGAWLLALERDLRPDVIHLNGYAHAALPWRAPALVVAHSCVRTWWRAVRGEAPPHELDAYTSAVRAGLGRADIVVAPTAAMRDALDAEYGPLPRTRVIPNGCAIAGDSEPANKAPMILSAGRVWDDAKNLAAVSDVAPDLPWAVCVAGETVPPDGTHVDRPGVRLLGQLSHDALTRWYRRAAIYALPARYEPFGLSVLEAARAGCALVLGDIASLRENWDGAALFVPPDDRRALVTALRFLIGDDAARTRLGAAAKGRSAAFTIARTADAYEAIYGVLRRESRVPA